MKYKNKDYKSIIWDWRSTIYDPLLNQLYPWVKDFFNENDDVDHYLISWTGNVQKRTELINSFEITKKFKKIYITGEKKRTVFEKIFDEEGVDADNTLIIGDNVNDEISIAKDLAVDSVLISKFIKDMGLNNT